MSKPSPLKELWGVHEEGHILTHDGYRLFFRRLGNGPQHVIIPIDVFTFDGLSALARPDRSLIFYDPRNRGRSDSVKDLSTVTVENDLLDIETIRKRFDWHRFSLIGYSVYGMEVALYAMEYPGHADRLVQLGPVPLKFGTQYPKEFDNTNDDSVFDGKLREELQTLREAHYDQTNPKEYCLRAWKFLGPGLVAGPDALLRLQPTLSRVCELPNEWPINFRKHVDAHFGSVTKLSVGWDRVRDAVNNPVLVVHGLRDRNAPYGAGREWAARLPDARLLTLGNAAHQSWVDEPEIVIPTISEFLEGHWPTSAQIIEHEVATEVSY